MSRRGLALVFLLFCLPLFFGLRSLDLETDEAIYSFSVDRILESGGWLEPKYSPDETGKIFLEKPPLKFWIVAAPIKAGLLPDDEFGLRFWDAAAGGLSFLYVFAIGSLLAGPVCGGVAVLLLFVHGPLVFEHGLRTNNMEGMLVLSYCGGIYHFLRWSRSAAPATRHAVAVSLYFVLGFMTKFVAAVFLPAVIGGAALLVPVARRRLVAEWKTWAAVSGLAVALIVPWFAYAFAVFGRELWDTMFAAHVVERFTASLNPMHVEAWNFYFVSMFSNFARARAQWLVAAGIVVLVVQSVRRRSLEGATVCLWMLPLVLISAGSSKLYHYAYPFIPPFALAAGYLLGLAALLAPMIVNRAAGWIEDQLSRLLPVLKKTATSPWIAGTASVLILAAAVVAAATIALGSVKVGYGRSVLLRNSSVLRPLLAMVVFAVIARRSARIATTFVLLVLAALLPFALYEQTLPRLVEEKHPLRDVRDCVQRVQANMPGAVTPGLYYDGDGAIWHPIYFYLRRVQPWTVQPTPNAARLAQALHDPRPQPALVQEARYRAYLAGADAPRFAQAVSPPIMELLEQVLLLPGPYEPCSSQAGLHQSR